MQVAVDPANGSGTVAAVVFDLGGTIALVDPPLLPAEPWRAYLEATAGAVSEVALARLLEAEHDAWLACRDEGRSDTIEAVLARAGQPVDERGLAAFWTCWRERTTFAPAARAVLAWLRAQRLRTGLLCNTIWPAGWHRQDLREHGLADCFDAMVFSSELPVAKPAPGAFASIRDRLGGVRAAWTVHVGDRLFEDVQGAQAAGQRAVLLGGAGAPSTAAPTTPRPDATITGLAELPELLGRWDPSLADAVCGFDMASGAVRP